MKIKVVFFRRWGEGGKNWLYNVFVVSCVDVRIAEIHQLKKLLVQVIAINNELKDDRRL
jgi:hypothetical protein